MVFANRGQFVSISEKPRWSAAYITKGKESSVNERNANTTDCTAGSGLPRVIQTGWVRQKRKSANSLCMSSRRHSRMVEPSEGWLSEIKPHRSTFCRRLENWRVER